MNIHSARAAALSVVLGSLTFILSSVPSGWFLQDYFVCEEYPRPRCYRTHDHGIPLEWIVHDLEDDTRIIGPTRRGILGFLREETTGGLLRDRGVIWLAIPVDLALQSLGFFLLISIVSRLNRPKKENA